MTKNRFFSAILLTAVFCCVLFRSGTAAADDAVSFEISQKFRVFCQNAAGKYVTQRKDDTVVVELIPVFGRLFASVGYYMEGKSLYSYYASELVPDCGGTEDCSESSLFMRVRSFSNMSNAGNFWPGDVRQRITLIRDGILLSGFEGDGDALVSAEGTMLTRTDAAPGMQVYGPAEAEMASGGSLKDGVPAGLAGAWKTMWMSKGTGNEAQVSFDTDGNMTMLLDRGRTDPPLLLTGGYALRNGSELCYLMSSPSSGRMPFQGCARLHLNGEALLFSSIPGEECLLLPDGASMMVYK